MNLKQFDAVAKLTGAKGKPCEAARQVILHGARPTDTARALDMSPQSVWNAVNRFRKANATILAAYPSPPLLDGAEQQFDTIAT